MTLPRLDPYLEGIGEPLEDLSRIAADQPYESRGRKITLGMKELAESGLATEKGKLTEQGGW